MSLANYVMARDLSREDRGYLVNLAPYAFDVLTARAREGGRDWTARLNKEFVVQQYIAAFYADPGDPLEAVVLDGSYAVLFQAGRLWHEQYPWILEQALFKIPTRHGSISRAMQGLEQLAKDRGCVGVAIGTSLAARDAGMARLFSRLGYEAHSLHLLKEL